MPNSERRALPVAPRPFEGEVLGGWIGRIAARYKMSVVEFEGANGLDFGLQEPRQWLLMDRLPNPALDVLMDLMRMRRQDILAIHGPPTVVGQRTAFFYCPRCVFVNEEDVTAPIWRREWFDERLTSCPRDGREFRSLKPSSVYACKNLNQLIAKVSSVQWMLSI